MTTTPIGSTRLQELYSLRDEVDREIARERAAIDNHNRLRTRLRRHRANQPPDLERSRTEETTMLVSYAAHLCGTPLSDVLGPSRSRGATKARHVVAWVLRHHGRTYVEIGKALRMHHSSALNGVRRVDGNKALLATAELTLRALNDGFPTAADNARLRMVVTG